MKQATTPARTTIKNTSRQRFSIPVFPHVKKFILKNYRTPDVVKVEEYTLLGKVITLALQDKRVKSEYNDTYRDRLTEEVTIVLTIDQARMSPRMNKLMRINIDVDRMFKDHLISWIYALRKAGIPPLPACRMFLSHYSINDDEYSIDAAYRFWQRNKDRNSEWASWNF